MKKVSVIIPVYKVEKYIATTVRSVLEQTYEDFELLIIDDGSPDQSIDICQQFTDSRMRIIRQQNRGAAAARNAGIRQAQGEYLAFLDGDDLWLPDKLEKHVEHLRDSPSVGVSFSRSAFIDEMGRPLGTYQMPKLKGITSHYLLRCNPVGNGSAPVIRREVFKAIEFQDHLCGPMENCYFDSLLNPSEDIECWLRIAIQTPWRIEGIPEVLTLYRVNPNGLSANLIEKLKSWEKMIDKTRSYAPELIIQWEKLARAHQLQYLARRAIHLQAGPIAVEFICRALTTYWRILLKDPRRMLLTLAAAYSLWLLPRPLYCRAEALGSKITGAIQRRCIHQETTERMGA